MTDYVLQKLGLAQYPTKLEETIQYRFRDRELHDQATTHCSSMNDRKGNDRKRSDNEKMEYLGDAILNTVISILLYNKYTDKDEGFLSNARSCLVNRETLTEVAHQINLERHMSYGSGRARLPRDSKVLSNMLEALIGAIYLDGGMEPSTRIIRKLFLSYFDEEKLREKNPKNALQEYAQKTLGVLPRYRLTRKAKDGFTMFVYVGTELKARGIGKSKREAEREAAAALLEQVREEA